MQVSVLGAGSWGTTVAALCARGHPTMLWSRAAEVAEGINRDHANPTYVREFRLPEELRATTDLDEAVSGADLLVVGVPAAGFRDVVRKAGAALRPWVPVVSLAKGLEAGTLLRMTQVVK